MQPVLKRGEIKVTRKNPKIEVMPSQAGQKDEDPDEMDETDKTERGMLDS